MNFITYCKLKSNYVKLNNDIVLFSEGNIYKNTNKPIIDKLSKSTKITYLTIDPHDEYLKKTTPNVYPLLVDLGFFGILFLKNISAKLFITTTPGLGSLTLKKSKKIQHYSYFMHAAPDIHRYAKFSFDCFDSIVCSGDFQINTLTHLEKVRNFPVKEKVALGVPYYDIMVQEYHNTLVDKNTQQTVLIAPSWGNSNFLNYYKKDLVDQLLQLNYHVILRPHPQSYKHEPRLIENIVNKHKKNPLFSLDKEISNITSMKQADLLISSYSGIIFDFIFLTEKPCILFDMADIGRGFEDQDIDFQGWENQLMPKIGKLISLEDSIDIQQLILEIENNQDKIISTIHQAKKEIANFGNCASKISEYYLKKVK